MADAAVVRVLLVDDQELARAGLRSILRPVLGFEVVGEAADGSEVPQAVRSCRPDVVVMDVRMPGVDGVEATRRLTADEADTPPVLVLTTFGEDEVLAGALRAGAAGFCLKDAPVDDLARAVRAVAAGDAWIDPTVAGRVLATYRADAATNPDGRRRLESLTTRELEVLRLVGRGLSNTEIADRLIVGEGTIKTHIGRLFSKLAVRDRAGAVVFAFDHGVVLPGGGPEDPPAG